MKKTILGLGALILILGTAGVLVDTAFAYHGDPTTKGPNYSEERHQAIVEAFESNDYEAWKNLMPEEMREHSRVAEIINQDNFAQFAEAHQLALKGDIEGAQEIRQGLGLGLGLHNNLRKGEGRRGNCFNR